MPFNPPIPKSNSDSNRTPDKPRAPFAPFGLSPQAGRMMEVAFLLPCSAFVGWGVGWWLDKTFHQTWISLFGILFGGISGIVYVVRMVVAGAGSNRQPPGAGNGGQKS